MVKKMLMQTKVMRNLPGQIIETNILTRLPVKTLIRFTAVCKSWYSLLFLDPYFINMYNQILKNKITNILLIDNNQENRIVAIDSCSPEQSLSSFNYISIDNPLNFVDVVGCCDGLVCVVECSYKIASSVECSYKTQSTKRKISLWNPALRIKKIINIYDQSPWSTIDRVCVGFGYHKQTQDYKVIRFYPYSFRRNHVVYVYSLASDSWRKIELNSNQIPTERYTVDAYAVYASSQVGGAYCWLAHKEDRHDRYLIEAVVISFNMKDEALKEITLPYTSTNTGCRNTLFIYKDSLAVFHTRNSDAFNSLSSRTCHVWVMKEYDDPKSWTKLINFDSPSCYVSFVGVIETELLLMRCGYGDDEEVIVIDIAKSQQKKTSSSVRFLIEAMWVGSFTESLALLKGSCLFKKLAS